MLKFKCDRCGKEMQRSEAWAIVLAPGAYAAEGARERTQGEICGDWWKVYGTRTKKVTHWMPMPEPPEE